MRRYDKENDGDENTPPGAESSGCNSGEGSHTGDSMDGDGGATKSSPPAKRRKENDDSEDLYRNDCEHEISKDQLSREMKKDKPNISRVKQLMDATYNQRREWIEYNAPSVSEVFEEYPSLKNGKVVSIIFWLAACECVCACMSFVCIVWASFCNHGSQKFGTIK